MLNFQVGEKKQISRDYRIQNDFILSGQANALAQLETPPVCNALTPRNGFMENQYLKY